MLRRKARTVGNSLIIAIPSQLAAAYGIEAGDKLKMDPIAAGILICKRVPA